MACLNINISKVLSPIKATISRVGELDAFGTTLHDIRVAVTALPRLNIAVTKLASIFNITTSDISKRMQVKYSVVCGLPDYDWDIVSMLFNDLMIGNKTLLINGDSSVVIRELESSTRILNIYYFKN